MTILGASGKGDTNEENTYCLAILFWQLKYICAKQQNAKINMLTSDEESSNIVLVSCNTKETQELEMKL